MTVLRMVTRITRLKVNGSAVVTVHPPSPCGLRTTCVAEVHVELKGQGPVRVHLDAEQREQLVRGLGGQIDTATEKLLGALDLITTSRNRNRADAKKWRERALAAGWAES